MPTSAGHVRTTILIPESGPAGNRNLLTVVALMGAEKRALRACINILQPAYSFIVVANPLRIIGGAG